MPQKKTGCFFHGHTNLRASHDSLTQESFHRNASADHLRPCWKNLQMKGFKELKKNIHQNQTKKRLTYINYVMCHSVFDDLGINLWPFSICVIAEAAVFFGDVRKAAALDGLRRKELSCSNAVTESLQKSHSESDGESDSGAPKTTEFCFTFPWVVSMLFGITFYMMAFQFVALFEEWRS